MARGGPLPKLSAAETLKLDRWAIETLGIPSVVLMNRAGQAVAEEVLKILLRPWSSHVLVICGNGNNGGDGFVAARYLWLAGVEVRVALSGSPADLKRDPRIYFSLTKKLIIPSYTVGSRRARFAADLRSSRVIVDAMFGVGLNRSIEGQNRKVIEMVNAAGKRIVAVDVPSGLDATTGKTWGTCVKAERTVTFTAPKKGFFLKDGPAVTGRIIVRNIGIPLDRWPKRQRE